MFRDNRVTTTWQEQQELISEIDNLKCDFQLNGYPLMFTDSIINKSGGRRQENNKMSLSSVVIPYVKGTSKKF
jgi:hypothetical protein